MVSCFFLLHLLQFLIYRNIYVIVNRQDTTTFEMEVRGRKQATAHAQSRCMWLNFEHTKNSNR